MHFLLRPGPLIKSIIFLCLALMLFAFAREVLAPHELKAMAIPMARESVAEFVVTETPTVDPTLPTVTPTATTEPTLPTVTSEPTLPTVTSEPTLPTVVPTTLPGIPLTIVDTGSNIELHWVASAQYQSYEVHRSTTPFFHPDANTLVTTLPAGSNVYTTPGAGLGQNTQPSNGYFYLVRGLSDQLTVKSNEVGEMVYALNNSGDKYSLIALPFPPGPLMDASSLANAIGNVTALLKWNPTTGLFRFFVPPSTGDNFTLQRGDLVFVQLTSSAPSAFRVVGVVEPKQYDLIPGSYNFLSLPLQSGALNSAQVAAQDITEVTSLLSWNQDTQLFRFFVPPATGDNFALYIGSPFIAQIGSRGSTPWPMTMAP